MDDTDRPDDQQPDNPAAEGEDGLLPAERELQDLHNGAANRVADIVARTFGGIVNPVVTSMMAVAAVVTGRPELTGLAIPTGVLAGVGSEEAVRAWHRYWAAGGVQQLKDFIEEESGEPVEDMMAGLGSNRKESHLLGEAVNAAAQSSDEWRIRTLARAYIAGAKSADKLDPMMTLVNALSGVQGKHVRVLAVLAKEPYQRTVDAVKEADPGLGHTVAILCRELERLGLVRFAQWNVVTLSVEGWSCASLLNELGSLHEEQHPSEAT